MAGKNRPRRIAVDREDYMVRVVKAMDPEAADAAFEEWLVNEGVDRSAFGPKELVVRRVRTVEGDKREYCVHYDALRRLSDDRP